MSGVEQRFPHAHEDQIDAFHIGVEIAQHDPILADDLVRPEVSPGPERPGDAEGTTHRATRLRGQAEGGFRAFPHRNPFDGHTVGELEKIFGRTIGTLHDLSGRRVRDHEPLSELRPQIERQIGHLGKGGSVSIDHPACHLRSTKAAVHIRRHRLDDLRRGPADEVGGL